jgi:E3 ubiquitin-protein ligase UBR4
VNDNKNVPNFISLLTFNDLLQMHAPCVKPTLMRTDSDDWKEFISKPALKYILRFLTGLATEHEHSQVSVVW